MAPTGTSSMTSTTSRSTRRTGAFAGTLLEAEASSAVAYVHRPLAVDGTRGGTGAERRDGRARIRQVSTYADLSRRVQDAGLLARRRAWYWQRMIGAATAFVMIWVAFFLLGDSWLQMGLAGLLAVVTAQFGFLGHDAAHRQIFVSVRWNEWSARLLSAVFAGLSYGWWLHKHNRHHRAPNQEGKDPDIVSRVLALTPAAAAAPRTRAGSWLLQRQGYLFFPLLLLEGVNLHAAGLRVLASRRDLKHRRLEASIVLARLATCVTIVFVVLPPAKALTFLAVQQGLFGVLLGGAFAPNHKGMPIVPADARIDFLSRQVLMSRDIRGGRFTDFAMGGLNYQIEHHLFPSMPRPNLRTAQPLVQAFCAEQGLTYTRTTLAASYGIVLRYLNIVGLRARDPFTCPSCNDTGPDSNTRR
jgi:fatty acid desaturase